MSYLTNHRTRGIFRVEGQPYNEPQMQVYQPKDFVEIGRHDCNIAEHGLSIEERLVHEVKEYNEEYGIASVADVVTELNTRCKDLEFQGKLDAYAHGTIGDFNEAQVEKMLNHLVREGKLRKVRREGVKDSYIVGDNHG